MLLRRTHLALLLAVFALVSLPAETGYAFVRLFRVNGTAGRPLTNPGQPGLRVGRPDGRPQRARDRGAVPDDSRATTGRRRVLVGSRVLEQVGRPQRRACRSHFEWTPEHVPEARAPVRPTRAARASRRRATSRRASSDSRFHIAGSVVTNDRGALPRQARAAVARELGHDRAVRRRLDEAGTHRRASACSPIRARRAASPARSPSTCERRTE